MKEMLGGSIERNTREELMSQPSVRTEFSRGWPKVLTGLVGVGLGSTSIFIYTQGLFIKPLQAEFGWSRGQASMMPTVFALTLAVMAPICGLMVDRFGVRLITAISVFCLSAGFWALSLMNGNLTQFAAIILFIGVMGSGTTAIPYLRLVGGWFDRSRGLAIGITMTGTGITALFAPRLVGAYIDAHGWRPACQLLAVAAVLALPLVLLWGREKSQACPVPRSGMRFTEAARTPQFWIMGLTFGLAGAAIAGLVPHFIPMLQDLGMSAPQAGAAFGWFGITIVGARFLTGFLCDHVFAPFIAAGVLILSAIGCLGLAFIGLEFAIVSALLIGLAMGAEIDLVGYMSARYFGLKSYGAIFGFQYGLFCVGAGVGPLLNGLLYDHFGNYQIALVTSAVILITGIPCVFLLGGYPERVAGEPAV
ncbi:hypothetical protein A6U85_25335 [Agrobacterium sp. 13-626]|nr:hypothetical protein A6U85_25335 [Agrobacterium sp. 13-626]